MATREEKRARLVAKLRTIRHAMFGLLSVEPAPGTVFNPLACFLDPGFLAAILSYFRMRASRDGIGAGLPRSQRAARLEDAAQAGLAHFLDRDYAAEGITADEVARAVITTVGRMRRRFWSDRAAPESRERGWFPYNRAQDSRTANPAHMVAAAERTPGGLAALTGTGTDEVKTGIEAVQGGRFRPRNHGRMQSERVVRRWVERVPFVSSDILRSGGGIAERVAVDCERVELGWTMVRGYGFATAFPACTVTRAADCCEVRQWTPPATPSPSPWTEEDRAAIVTRRGGSAEWVEVLPDRPSRARHWLRAD